MTQTAEKSKSRDVFIRLIRTIDHIEQSQLESRISMPGPDCDPDSYFNDIPEGFYDKELMDIQNMSVEALDTELAKLGYSDDKMITGINAAQHPNVVPFPSEKPSVQVDPGQWLQMNILGSVMKEAIDKSFLLSKKELPDLPPKTQQKSKSVPEIGKKKTTIKSVLAMFTFILITSVTFAKDPLIAAFNNTKEQLLLSIHNALKPADSEIYLNYGEAIVLLDRVKNGEINMTIQQRRNLYEKMYTLAKSDAKIMQQKNPNYRRSNACSTKGQYEHSVRSGDTVAEIVNGCGYHINYDMAKFKATLNINDLVVISVRNSEVLNIELHKKSGIIPIYNSAL